MKVFHLDIRADSLGSFKCGFSRSFHDVAAVRQIIGRNPLPPPELTGDAPVAGVLHPVAVGIDILLGNELRASAFHGVERHLGQGVHLEEPLGGQARLDHRIGPLGVTDRRSVFFHFFQVAGFLEHLHDLLAGHETVLTHEDTGLLVQLSVLVDDVQDLQVVPEADLVVMHVVGRSHFQAAGTEVHLHIIILDHRDLPVDERDQDLLSTEPMMTLIVGIHADGGVGHDGLGTGGRDDEILVGRVALSVGDIVPEMIEMALGVLVDHLVVTDGGKGLGIPVDHPDALVDPSFLVKIDKGIDNSLGQSRFHGETSAVPVAGGTEFPELVQDDATMLLLPFPGMLQELLPGEVVLGDALGLEFRHHLGLGSDGGMVRSGDPAGILAMHAGVADQDIVQGVVQDVSHMEDTRHVGRRDHDGIGFLLVRFRMEEFVLQPIGIPLVFHFRGIVLRC